MADTTTGSAVRRVATHPHVRTTLRQAAHVVVGGHVVTRRAWDSRTTARHERMMALAEAKGDHQTAYEWANRADAFRKDRHARRMDMLLMPVRLAKAAVIGTGITAVGLLALGVALAITNHAAHDALRPLRDAVAFVQLLWTIGADLSLPVAVGLPVAFLGWLWHQGRTHGTAPNWLMPEAQRTDTAITPSSVVVALRDLGVSALTKGIKAMPDNGASMLGPIRIAGCGVEVDVQLPSGVATSDVQSRRKRLAENLGRHEHELFISIPQAARTVRLWIADSGALDEPIGPSPLVLDADSTADYYTGRFSWGQTLRGDSALISVFQRMLLLTGLSNEGKTASLRALALWLAHDVTVEFRAADLKGVGDWRWLDGIATVLVQGPTDAHVIAATEMLEAMVEEMERRLTALEQSGATDGVTREMARKPGSGFHPLVGIVDEAQVAYMCPALDENRIPYGGQKATSRYLNAVRKIHNQGRAVNVTLWEGTQDPTDRNLPKLSREGNHVRASLVLGTESQARMALGDAAVDGGAAPHQLRQGLDKGKVVVAGDGIERAPGESSITVRTHFISGKDAVVIGDRIKALRARSGRTLAKEAARADRDVLADILTVLGEEARVRTLVVLSRLAALDADAYEGTTPERLTEILMGAGCPPYKSSGSMVVSRERLADAIAARDENSAAS